MTAPGLELHKTYTFIIPAFGGVELVAELRAIDGQFASVHGAVASVMNVDPPRDYVLNLTAVVGWTVASDTERAYVWGVAA